MSVLECFTFSIKRLLEKRNILFIIVLTFIMLIIWIAITFMNFAIDYVEVSFEDDPSYKMITTNMPKNEVVKLDNVVYYNSEKFLGSKHLTIDLSHGVGQLNLKALLPFYHIEITNGHNIETGKEAICPEYYYPDEFRYDDILDYAHFIKNDELIGRTFKVESTNEEKLGQITEFTIVGTYKNIPFLDPQTCFITEEDYDDNASNISYVTGYIDADTGEEIIEKHEYSTYVLFVDKHENVLKVANIIKEQGYFADYSSMDMRTMGYIFYIPLFISIIVLIISVSVIYSFLAKKYNYRKYEFGIFKALGYRNSDIKKLEIIENIIISIVSSILAFVLLLLVYYIVARIIFSEFVFYNYIIPIPVLYIIIFGVFMICLIVLLSNIDLNLKLKANSYTLLKNEVL